MNWTSVKERLPERNGFYLAYTPTGTKGFDDVILLYYWGKDKWEDEEGMAPSEYYGITHWQPLPEPPGEL